MAPLSDTSSRPELIEANDTLHASDGLLFPLAASDHDSTSYTTQTIMEPDQPPPDTTSDDGYGSLSDSTYEIVSRSSVQASDSDNDTNDAQDTDNESLASFRAPTPSESNESDEDQPDTPAADNGCESMITPPPEEREESFEEERLRAQYPDEANAESEVVDVSSPPAISAPEEVPAEHELEIPSLDTSTIKASTVLSNHSEDVDVCATSPSASTQSVDEWIHFEETPDVAEGLVDITKTGVLEDPMGTSPAPHDLSLTTSPSVTRILYHGDRGHRDAIISKIRRVLKHSPSTDATSIVRGIDCMCPGCGSDLKTEAPMINLCRRSTYLLHGFDIAVFVSSNAVCTWIDDVQVRSNLPLDHHSATPAPRGWVSYFVHGPSLLLSSFLRLPDAYASQAIQAALELSARGEGASHAQLSDFPAPPSSTDWVYETGAAARARLDEAQAAVGAAARQCREAIHDAKQTAQRAIKAEVRAWRNGHVEIPPISTTTWKLTIGGALLVLLADSIMYCHLYGLPPILWSILGFLLTPVTLVTSSISEVYAASQPSILAYNWTMTSQSGNSIWLHHDNPLDNYFVFNTTSIVTGRYHALTFDPANDVAYAQIEGARTKIKRRGPRDLEVSLPFGRCDDIDLAVTPIVRAGGFTQTIARLRKRCTDTRFDRQLTKHVKGALTWLSALHTRFREWDDTRRARMVEMLPSKGFLRRSFDKAAQTFTNQARHPTPVSDHGLTHLKSRINQARIANPTWTTRLARAPRRLAHYVKQEARKEIDIWRAMARDLRPMIEAAEQARRRELRAQEFKALKQRIANKLGLCSSRLLPHAEGCAERRQARKDEMKQRREVRALKTEAWKERLDTKLGFLASRSKRVLTMQAPSPKQQLVKARRRALSLRQRLRAWYWGQTDGPQDLGRSLEFKVEGEHTDAQGTAQNQKAETRETIEDPRWLAHAEIGESSQDPPGRLTPASPSASKEVPQKNGERLVYQGKEYFSKAADNAEADATTAAARAKEEGKAAEAKAQQDHDAKVKQWETFYEPSRRDSAAMDAAQKNLDARKKKEKPEEPSEDLVEKWERFYEQERKDMAAMRIAEERVKKRARG